MRFRDGEQLDPGAAREFAAVDAALAGQPVDPGQEQLAELTLALRAERPVPEERFARDLDAIVARGFRPPTEEGDARKAGLPGFLRPRLRLALATVASVFIAGTAVFSSGMLDGDERAGVPAGDRAQPAATGSADNRRRRARRTAQLQRRRSLHRTRRRLPPVGGRRKRPRQEAATAPAGWSHRNRSQSHRPCQHRRTWLRVCAGARSSGRPRWCWRLLRRTWRMSPTTRSRSSTATEDSCSPPVSEVAMMRAPRSTANPVGATRRGGGGPIAARACALA